NNEKFIPGFTSAYFNMSAEKAFLQHFPQDKRWQNEYDMTLEEFDAQPVYSQSYFKTWTHGITHQVKYLKRGFLDSYWVKFRSKSEIRTLNAGGRLTLPFIRFGDYYLLCISPAQKGGITRIIINDEVTLAYINK
ncbi:MAG: hypothetical protein JW798_17545, partial [Prolixibacteraceae bacterium]|nr:hypothetical protein [Prolixibacteraceae bacterium]